ncbi:MAG TPA: dihydrolipoamide acetyltransferase family protein, partial [Candidatus Nanopelagicales bacterium]|nr:dihydrolipoamide acetyltransferase family protein [Candidatus Nanopelagicales bacterium]
MPELLRMPEVATGSTSAVLSAWQVPLGQEYVAGEVIAVLETDKAVVDMEAEAAGSLVHLLAEAGQEVATGEPIAVWAQPGEQVADPVAAAALLGVGTGAPAKAEPESMAKTTGEAASELTSEPAPELTLTDSGERIFASPIARRMAREAKISLATLVGSGPNGRIRRRDVEAAMSAAPSTPVAPAKAAVDASGSPAGYREIPHTRLRKAIANRLTESKSTVPHFYLRGTAVVDDLLAMRAQMNEGEDNRISVNDFIIKAVAYAHSKVPEANVIWTQDAVRVFDTVDISVAIATETGLVTPVVRDVGSLSLGQLALITKDFAARAKEGTLRQTELEGGSTSVSNLGMFGTEGFDAIINPPQSTILAVGAAQQQP